VVVAVVFFFGGKAGGWGPPVDALIGGRHKIFTVTLTAQKARGREMGNGKDDKVRKCLHFPFMTI